MPSATESLFLEPVSIALFNSSRVIGSDNFTFSSGVHLRETSCPTCFNMASSVVIPVYA